jgi:hypothetical protein
MKDELTDDERREAARAAHQCYINAEQAGEDERAELLMKARDKLENV